MALTYGTPINFFSATLDGAISSSATTAVLSTVTAGTQTLVVNTYLVFEPTSANNKEIVYITSINAGTKTVIVTRGVGGTTAVAHADGVEVIQAPLGTTLEDLKANLEAYADTIQTDAEATAQAYTDTEIQGHDHTGSTEGSTLNFITAILNSGVSFSHPLLTEMDGTNDIGAGSTSEEPLFIISTTGTNSGDQETRGTGGGTRVFQHFGDSLAAQICVRLVLGTTQDAVWGYYAMATTSHFPVNGAPFTNIQHVAFFVEDGTLYASIGNGSGGVTRTDVSSGITLTNMNNYVIVYTPSVSAKFYINGTLVATRTETLPTALNSGFYVGIKTQTAAARTLWWTRPVMMDLSLPTGNGF